jgi:hypothetical protein
MEKSYQDYIRLENGLLSDKAMREAAHQMKTLGKFKKCEINDGEEGSEEIEEGGAVEWEAIPYEGYTLITPTFFDDQNNEACYSRLKNIQDVILNLSLISKPAYKQFVAAPAEAFHMTLARLISDDMYTQRLQNTREDDFLAALSRLFEAMPSSGSLNFEVRGIALFHGVIAALVAPATEQDYQRLQEFRDSIYNDPELTELGVERKRGFNGHISLLYLEEDLSGADREILAAQISDINQKFFAKPLLFTVIRGEVRKFNNFLRFYREEEWPVRIF